MHESIQRKRLTRPPRGRALALTALITGVVISGCGGSSSGPTTGAASAANPPAVTAGAPTTGSSTTTGTGTTSAGPTAPGAGGSGALAFAQCMRANGVPNFPDPAPGGRFVFQAGGVNPNAPAFRAAQANCRKLLPSGGPPVPGTQTHPSSATLAKLLAIARCMHQHGVSDFPDPRTSVPSNVSPGTVGVITDFDGAILLFPATMNLQAPAYKHALAACGSPPLGLPH